jgi:hypothetical protein
MNLNLNRGIFQENQDFFDPQHVPSTTKGNFGDKKSMPLEKTFKIADYVFCPHD